MSNFININLASIFVACSTKPKNIIGKWIVTEINGENLNVRLPPMCSLDARSGEVDYDSHQKPLFGVLYYLEKEMNSCLEFRENSELKTTFFSPILG